MDNRDNKKEHPRFQSKGLMLLMILFLLILILTFFFGDRGVLEIIKARQTVKSLNQKVLQLEKEKETLSAEVRQLKENPRAIEKKAREKLWLMKKNEKVVVLEKKDKTKERP